MSPFIIIAVNVFILLCTMAFFKVITSIIGFKPYDPKVKFYKSLAFDVFTFLLLGAFISSYVWEAAFINVWIGFSLGWVIPLTIGHMFRKISKHKQPKTDFDFEKTFSDRFSSNETPSCGEIETIELKAYVNLELMKDNVDDFIESEFLDILVEEISDELVALGMVHFHSLEKTIIPCEVSFVPQVRFRVTGVFQK